MATFDLLIVPSEVAKAIDAYWDGVHGFGPKIAYPDVRPKPVKIAAGSAREAAELALQFNPGWAVASSNIMKARNA